MIDKVKIFAKAGDGGHGCTSFRRSRNDGLGRPDGTLSSLFYYAVLLHNFFDCLILSLLCLHLFF